MEDAQAAKTRSGGLPQSVAMALAQHQKYARGLPAGRRGNLAYVDFGGVALVGLRLQSLVAPGANFSGCNLSGTDLQFADLFGANLEAANCSSTNFQRSDLRGAKLRGATLVGANFQGADLRPGFLVAAAANVSGSSLAQSRFDGANM